MVEITAIRLRLSSYTDMMSIGQPLTLGARKDQERNLIENKRENAYSGEAVTKRYFYCQKLQIN